MLTAGTVSAQIDAGSFSFALLALPKSAIPEPRLEVAGWMNLVLRDLAEAEKGGWELVLVGDSITDGWRRGEPYQTWGAYYSSYKTLNLGLIADKTENVLWRLDYEGMLDGYTPRLFIVMIGTNNTGHRYWAETADDTARGIRAILDTLAVKAPQSRILLLAIFPRAEEMKRVRNDEVNLKIEKFADNKRVFWLNINSEFLKDDGTINLALYKDELPFPIHLNNAGYEVWATAMHEKVTELMGE